MDLYISQAEALLSGLCLGEYLTRKSNEPELSFFSILDGRIEPFIPDRKRIRSLPIKEKDIPADIQWLPIRDMRIGRSASTPNFFFGIDEKGAYQKKLDYSEKNLVELLTIHLLDHVGMGEDMRQWLKNCFVDHLDVAKQADDLLALAVLNPATLAFDGRKDDVAGIEHAFMKLICYNHFERPFQMGKDFGQVVAALHLYEKNLPSLLFMALFGSAMARLCQMEESEASLFTRSALLNVLAHFEEEREATQPMFEAFRENEKLIRELLESGGLPDQFKSEDAEGRLDAYRKGEFQRRERILPRLDQARMMIWVAFGDMLGFFRNLPDNEEHRGPLLSRSFLITDNDSPDNVRDAIRVAERELCRSTMDSSFPERVINNTASAIEALTKRTWANEYTRRKSLPDLYHDKIENGDELERRFARTALSLYKAYRNPAVHQFDSFQCTIAEARYFVAGIRMLWELYDTIVKRAGGQIQG